MGVPFLSCVCHCVVQGIVLLLMYAAHLAGCSPAGVPFLNDRCYRIVASGVDKLRGDAREVHGSARHGREMLQGNVQGLRGCFQPCDVRSLEIVLLDPKASRSVQKADQESCPPVCLPPAVLLPLKMAEKAERAGDRSHRFQGDLHQNDDQKSVTVLDRLAQSVGRRSTGYATPLNGLRLSSQT